MKKLIGVLFIAAAACAPATAQQEKKLSITDAPPAIQTNQVVPIQPGFKLVSEFPPTQNNSKRDLGIRFPREGFVINQTKWVFKDGSVYIDILGTGTLIPLPGGGASGCFDLNLKERIAELRSRIEAYPPHPAPATPRQ